MANEIRNHVLAISTGQNHFHIGPDEAFSTDNTSKPALWSIFTNSFTQVIFVFYKQDGAVATLDSPLRVTGFRVFTCPSLGFCAQKYSKFSALPSSLVRLIAPPRARTIPCN
jgi:hypothetical protein